MSYPSDHKLRNAALQIVKEAIALRASLALPQHATGETDTLAITTKAVVELAQALKAVQTEIQNEANEKAYRDRKNPQAPVEVGPFVFAPLPSWMGPGNPG